MAIPKCDGWFHFMCCVLSVLIAQARNIKKTGSFFDHVWNIGKDNAGKLRVSNCSVPHIASQECLLRPALPVCKILKIKKLCYVLCDMCYRKVIGVIKNNLIWISVIHFNTQTWYILNYNIRFITVSYSIRNFWRIKYTSHL